MKKLLTLLILLTLTGCGSVFLEDPQGRPYDDCALISQTMFSDTPKTWMGLPFDGAREARLYTAKPPHWEDFEGSVHLISLDWNLDWVNQATFAVGGFTVGAWDGQHWNTSDTVDLKPALTLSQDRDLLYFDARLRAKGWKPKGEQRVEVSVEVDLCGKNADLVASAYWH